MDGLIILDGSGRPIVQSNFRAFPGTYPLTVVDAFNDAETQAQNGHPKADLDSVLYFDSMTASCVCCHVSKGGLRFLCVASRDVDPLLMNTFLERFLDILQDYLHEVSLPSLKEHFDVVYQLLEEMLDDGVPLTTESNVLRDIVLPPSFFDKILSVAGVSGLSTAAATPLSSPLPWRRAGVKHGKNEIYFDINEKLEAIVSRNGSLLSSEISGQVGCNSRLSGTPDLLLTFSNSRMFADPSFHHCVRLQRFLQNSTLSFVPPDGNFTLMDYSISPSALTSAKTSAVSSSIQNQLNLIPVILKPSIQLAEKTGTFTFVLTPRAGAQYRHQMLETVDISLYLGGGATGAHCSVSFNGGGLGGGGLRDREKEDRAAGTWSWKPLEKTIRWIVPSMSGTSTTGIWTLKGTFTSVDVNPRPSRSVMLALRIPHVLFSNLKVEQLKVMTEMYKPYKGVRATSTELIEWRW